MTTLIMREVVQNIVGKNGLNEPKECGQAYAPTNIALIKYWGKRNTSLNLPMTDSLSVSLPGIGATTTVKINECEDQVFLNGQRIQSSEAFSMRASLFLDLFRSKKAPFFQINTEMNIPPSAGLASSACGFAALVLALNQLFGWELRLTDLSILARLGSGSACRSIFPGFVKWQAGVQDNGLDSFAQPCDWVWKDLCLGLVMISQSEKPISSRLAMQNTVESSYLYQSWPAQVQQNLMTLEQSIIQQDFDTFGRVVEHNALSMHATMLSASPPIVYSLPETLRVMQTVWRLRQQGLAVFFTQDAGPNLKLFFQKEDLPQVQSAFDLHHIVHLFDKG